MSEVKVLAIVGSLRRGSVNRQLAETAVENAPDGVTVRIYEGLAALPHYNEDTEGPDAPAEATALRTAVDESDAVLFVTPEYNGTIPAGVKDAIDWLSRPYGSSVFDGKPTAVIGASLGQYGGVWAHDETRKSAAIATAKVLDHVKFDLPISKLEGKHPREDANAVAELVKVLTAVAEAAS